MRVSLITTVKNEEKSILQFLNSIKKQTKKPDEIIIVDGGSRDNTMSVVHESLLKVKTPIRIIKKGGNRSVGRNTAIKSSKNKIIACTDAGCILDKNWLEKITKPFEDKSIEVVAGFYNPIATSTFEKCLATYTCVMEDKLDPKNFLPSSRSIAFRKSAWEKVGGYPENLDTCEDLVFARSMKKAGLRFVTIKNAIVYWPQRKNIWQAAKQFFYYAKGDGKAGFMRKSAPFLFGRYIIGIFILGFIIKSKNFNLLPIVYILLILYVLWAILKNYKYVKKIPAIFYLPLLQFVSDIAVINGTIIGVLERLWDIKIK